MMDGGGGYTLYNEDFLAGAGRVADGSVDLVIADPPYGLGKDYGNDSDKRQPGEFLEWTAAWVDAGGLTRDDGVEDNVGRFGG